MLNDILNVVQSMQSTHHLFSMQILGAFDEIASGRNV